MTQSPSDWIKANIDLVTEVEKRGVKLKTKGKDKVGLCPFHDEKTPSFHITPAKKLWHCFGCDKGGSVIDFLKLSEGWEIREIMKQHKGEPMEQKPEKHTKQKPTYTKEEAEPDIINVIAYYQKSLANHPEAMDYLKQRGLQHPDLVSTFQIGFADRSLLKKLTSNGTKPDPVREKLKIWGILRDSGQEHFRGCLTFPIFQQNGHLGEIYGRRISRHSSPHLYLPDEHQGIFNHTCLGAQSPLILCESIIDALTCWVHDFRHVTSSFGANGFTDEMLEAFQSKAIKTILLAYDNDKRGNEAANILAKRLIDKGFIVGRLMLPKEMDINQYVLDQEKPKDSLQTLINQCQMYPSSKNKTQPVSTLASWNGKQAVMTLGERQYRMRGVEKNQTVDALKIQLRVTQADYVFLDNIDLAVHRQRLQFATAAASELSIHVDVIKKDLGRVLTALEQIIETHIQVKEEKQTETKTITMTPEAQTEALDFLKQPDLLKQILVDFDVIGLVGEDTNKTVGYLAAISRKLEDPLAILIQSSSSAGKTTLMDAILSLVPPEDQEKWTTLTGQALYYIGEKQLVHKLLAVAEEEGAEKASYPLKILQSEKMLKIATTVKDPKSGEFHVQEKEVKGPCAILLTSTAAEIDEELQNRFIRLTVDENQQQTLAIHKKQRQGRTLEGLKHQLRMDVVRRKHHNAQRLIKPMMVINPYAEQLTFRNDFLRSRRDHKKYLGLMEANALLHQYQRQIKVIEIEGERIEYIEIEIADIEVANILITEILGHCIDELAPQTRRLLNRITEFTTLESEAQGIDIKTVTFTRRNIREFTHWSDNQLKVHMKRLEDLEYLFPLQGSRGNHYVYQLLTRDENEGRFLAGLIDVSQLKKTMRCM